MTQSSLYPIELMKQSSISWGNPKEEVPDSCINVENQTLVKFEAVDRQS